MGGIGLKSLGEKRSQGFSGGGWDLNGEGESGAKAKTAEKVFLTAKAKEQERSRAQRKGRNRKGNQNKESDDRLIENSQFKDYGQKKHTGAIMG